MRHLIVAALCFVSLTAQAAESWTTDQQAFLQEQLGLGPNNPLMSELTPDERVRIRAALDNPFAEDYVSMRVAPITSILQAAYARTCSEWRQTQTAPQCPPVADPKAQAGKDIADNQCHSCHLFGTPLAPAFFKMARTGGWSAKALGAALDSGHRMSPIHLLPEQVQALADYIASLK